MCSRYDFITANDYGRIDLYETIAPKPKSNVIYIDDDDVKYLTHANFISQEWNDKREYTIYVPESVVMIVEEREDGGKNKYHFDNRDFIVFGQYNFIKKPIEWIRENEDSKTDKPCSDSVKSSSWFSWLW